MNQKDFDLVKLSKLTSHHIDHVTCLECCKYYIAPATAACGHSLCHTCWRGRRTCPVCATTVDRKALKLNLPLQALTQHAQSLGEAFEKLFNIKLDEFSLDSPDAIGLDKDPNKHVKDWLTSSQNHFSATISHSQQSGKEQHANPLEISASNILIHTDVKKFQSPPKVVYTPPPQDDWDKIQPMDEPVLEKRNKENIIGPMDIEPFFVDDSEYTANNPRRSSRKRDMKNDENNLKTSITSANKHTSRDSSGDNERKSEKNKQNWNNVKKMKKEFSKLNKKNRSKLNVSIEMVKKTQNLKTSNSSPLITQQIFNIDDNTPDIANKGITLNINENHPHKYLLSDNSQEVEKLEDDILIKQSKTNNLTLADPITKTINENSVSTDLQGIANIKNPEPHCNANSTEINSNKKETAKTKESPQTKLPFIKKCALVPRNDETLNKINNCDTNAASTSSNADDIEITIKVGSTITSILIKKKESDVQVKVNTDCGIQTSLGDNGLISKEAQSTNTASVQVNLNNDPAETSINVQSKPNTNKSASTKKNTASADTATAQFEITESVEKEMSKIMECEGTSDETHSKKNSVSVKPTPKQITQNKNIYTTQTKENINQNELDDINDLDIFGSGSIKDTNVQLLKDPAPSEILISTVRSKFRTQKLVEKRDRDIDDDILPQNKKIKVTQKQNLQDEIEPDSEPINYDAVMGQVFANIDADIEDIQSQKDLNTVKPMETEIEHMKDQTKYTITETQINKPHSDLKDMSNDYINQKHSENVFTIMEKEDENNESIKNYKIPEQIDELLTPVLCRNLNSSQESQDDLNRTSKSRRKSLHDDSESVVEETPQKDVSVTKLKRASTSNRDLNKTQEHLMDTKKLSLKSSIGIKSIINVTDTLSESNKSSRDTTVVDAAGKKQTLETPLTITKFADQIKHKSTPVARKSLNFDTENFDDDPERTLCPTAISKTTQEKEFLSKAFESTPTSGRRPFLTKNINENLNKKLCLAGSCLASHEIVKIKNLCKERNWTYLDKYTKDVTHLVVGVDEENKSQRSVKYMSALAASKWIVSFEWVKQCIITKSFVNEEPFEAIDTTGDPGPRRARIAKRKLFHGITFYCMPPFSVLDMDTLKDMLVSAGGRVVEDLEAIRIPLNSREPALLLAEPENTQEDRFIYLTMELGVVPVNYEWVLNCLGSYTLSSIYEQLLCPTSLIPPSTATWPQVLIAQED